MARDPYQRLWSVYVDKFILLDMYFWRSFLKEIIDTSRNHNIPKERISQCANVTFREFLTYVVEKGQTNPQNLDPHMRPIHYVCNPCVYQPHFIGRVESLTDEKEPILRRLGLQELDDVQDFKHHVINEIDMITEFEYKLWAGPHPFKSCMDEIQLEKRIIKVFILNGYLLENVEEKLPPLPLGHKRISSMLSEAFVSTSRNIQEISLQRELLRTEAYKTVPRNILERLRDLYKYDFILFGYDNMPASIFQNEEKT